MDPFKVQLTWSWLVFGYHPIDVIGKRGCTPAVQTISLNPVTGH